MTALSLVCLPASAQADATITEGKVSVSVKGTGLSVSRAGGWMDGLGTGVRARLYTVYQGSRTDLTKWKDATPRTAGMTQFSDVDWNLHGKRFTHGTWLCIQFNKSDDAPSAKILR
ncbi:hypothetical protein N4G69_53795 [Streptomyces mirabilis]|uniref:hypothetical protein n=1 Tax=Streptomyces mirabilis TaxID=68239 RepID=UPI0021BEB66A|nr:hypothetical protein [Streptomyces mirabilis]MCT9114206.1 hypothetical protein [Streptomyces mirabilis]